MKARLYTLRQALTERKLAALLVLTQEDDNKNLFYLTGFSGSAGMLMVTAKQSFFFVDGRYRERARQEASGCRVFDIVRREEKGETIARGLRLGQVRRGARIGYEGRNISVLMAKEWHRRVPAVLVPTDGLVEKLRQWKDASEIAALARAGKVTSEVFEQVTKRIRAGMRECEVALELDHALRKAGASAPSFETIVASGVNSALPHHRTGSRRLRKGEPVVIDFGGRFESGYCSDMTRTIFVPGKKPSKKLLEIYRIVREANEKVFAEVKPGMSWKEYDALARDYIAARGYGKQLLHGLGHSLGLEPHDPYDYKNDPIMVGTVFTNEPGIYLPGVGGVRIEDDLVMTKRGARKLTTAPAPSLQFF